MKEFVVWIGEDWALFNRYAMPDSLFFYRVLPFTLPQGTRLVVLDDPLLSMHFFQFLNSLPPGVPIVVFSSLSPSDFPDLPDVCRIYFKPLLPEEIEKILFVNALPSKVTNVFTVGDMEIGWWFSPGGGDFIEVYHRGDRVILIMGDMEGHDIAAWGDSFTWRAYIDSVMRYSIQPHEILYHLQIYLEREGRDIKNCALNVMEINREGILFAIAGMPSPMILQDGKWIMHPGRGSLPGLGRYIYTYTLPSKSLDAALFFSDGFFDPSFDKEWKIKPDIVQKDIIDIVSQLSSIKNKDDASFVFVKKKDLS